MTLTPATIAALEGHRVRVTDHTEGTCFIGTAAPLFRGGPAFFSGLKLEDPTQIGYHERNNPHWRPHWTPEAPVQWLANTTNAIEIEVIE